MNTNKDQVIVDKDKYDDLLEMQKLFETKSICGLRYNNRFQSIFIPLTSEETISILKKEIDDTQKEIKSLRERNCVIQNQIESKLRMAESIKNSKPWWRWW